MHNSIHQSFAFYNKPIDFLSDEQKQFIHLFTHKKIDSLRFLIPIQSKTFVFPCDYKEFELISLKCKECQSCLEIDFMRLLLKRRVIEKNLLPI